MGANIGIVTIAVIGAVYHGDLRMQERVVLERWTVPVDRLLLWKSLAVAAGMVLLFFIGWPVPNVALMAGALLLVSRRLSPEKVYQEIDWPLLVLFAGLFIVVAGVERTSVPVDFGADSA